MPTSFHTSATTAVSKDGRNTTSEDTCKECTPSCQLWWSTILPRIARMIARLMKTFKRRACVAKGRGRQSVSCIPSSLSSNVGKWRYRWKLKFKQMASAEEFGKARRRKLWKRKVWSLKLIQKQALSRENWQQIGVEMVR